MKAKERFTQVRGNGSDSPSTAVMAGLVQAIHAFLFGGGVRVDARMRGHDGER